MLVNLSTLRQIHVHVKYRDNSVFCVKIGLRVLWKRRWTLRLIDVAPEMIITPTSRACFLAYLFFQSLPVGGLCLGCSCRERRLARIGSPGLCAAGWRRDRCDDCRLHHPIQIRRGWDGSHSRNKGVCRVGVGTLTTPQRQAHAVKHQFVLSDAWWTTFVADL